MDMGWAVTGVVIIALLMWALSRSEPDNSCYTGYYGPLDWDSLWDEMDHKRG